MMSIGALIAILAPCVAVQAFFSASELAIVMADEIKVRAEAERGASGARRLGRLLERRDRLLAMILTVTNLTTAIAAAALTSFLHARGTNLEYLAAFMLAPLTLIVGESIPKLLVIRRPLAYARLAAPPLRALGALMAPLLTLETLLGRAVRRLAGVAPDVQNVFLTREDLARVVGRSSAESALIRDAILPRERQMISRIFRFSRSDARQAMVPLVRVEAVPGETTVAGALDVVRRTRFSRIPVFDQRIVNIIGMVHVFDLLEAPDPGKPVKEIMRPVSYFSEAAALDDVLLALQRTGQSLAVIVDEYGGAAGIITLEDLLEEVVGEIEDEHRAGEDLIRVIDSRTLRVSGLASVVELNERFGLKLTESNEYATIGGLVVERLGHIPAPGDQVTMGDVAIAITRADARAVRELVIHLPEPLDAAGARRQ